MFDSFDFKCSKVAFITMQLDPGQYPHMGDQGATVGSPGNTLVGDQPIRSGWGIRVRSYWQLLHNSFSGVQYRKFGFTDVCITILILL